MSKRYAISDIHGNYRTFVRAMDSLQLAPSDTLFLLGDYVDKGPDSRQVINHILALQADGYQINCLLGNHEVYMLWAMAPQSSTAELDSWLNAGGWSTLTNYKQPTGEGHFHPDLAKHLDWMGNLPVLLELEDYLLVHAGFNFFRPDLFSDTHAMLFIRNWYADIDPSKLAGRTILHGHTPITRSAMSSQLDTSVHQLPVLNIDAGCFFYREGFGHLAVFDLDDRVFHFFPNEDMPLAAIREARIAKTPTI